MSDYAELKRLAEDAVKGSENWLAAGIRTQLFAATCTPSAVLDLIAERDQLKAENEALKGLANTAQKAAELMSNDAKRLKTKLETIRCLLGSSVPSDEQLDIAIDAAIRNGEQS